MDNLDDKRLTIEERITNYKREYKEVPKWLGTMGSDLMWLVLKQEEEIARLRQELDEAMEMLYP